ncbi:MAG: hypothetical protein HRT70_07865 [Flavobacteriaceae bacterium]|nr:hypothetical protein [Flavobacteriaceae bacterium]
MIKVQKIEQAIAAQKVITFDYLKESATVKPLIYGEDFYEQPFLYAYIPHNAVYYKYTVALISNVKVSNLSFRLTDDISQVYFGPVDEDIFVSNPLVRIHDGRFSPDFFDQLDV